MFTIGNVDGGLIIEVLIKDNNHNLLNYYYRQESAQVVHQPYLISDVFDLINERHVRIERST